MNSVKMVLILCIHPIDQSMLHLVYMLYVAVHSIVLFHQKKSILPAEISCPTVIPNFQSVNNVTDENFVVVNLHVGNFFYSCGLRKFRHNLLNPLVTLFSVGNPSLNTEELAIIGNLICNLQKKHVILM